MPLFCATHDAAPYYLCYLVLPLHDSESVGRLGEWGTGACQRYVVQFSAQIPDPRRATDAGTTVKLTKLLESHL